MGWLLGYFIWFLLFAFLGGMARLAGLVPQPARGRRQPPCAAALAVLERGLC